MMAAVVVALALAAVMLAYALTIMYRIDKVAFAWFAVVIVLTGVMLGVGFSHYVPRDSQCMKGGDRA